VFLATILIYLDLQRQLQIRFLYSVRGVEGSAICEKNHSVAVEPEPVSVQVVERVGLVSFSALKFFTRLTAVFAEEIFGFEIRQCQYQVMSILLLGLTEISYSHQSVMR